MVTPKTIGIVGCGVAGLTAALLLARDGHHVTVFERSEQVGPVGAGILLQPSGQLVLDRIGLLGQVTANAARIDRLKAITHRGHRLIDLPYAAAGTGLHAYGLHRGDLFSVLHEQACIAGVRIELNCRIARIIETAHGVELHCSNEINRGTFDLLLIADGVRSALREATGLAASVHLYPHAALWALGSCESVRDHLLQITHGTRLLTGLLPMGQGRCSLFWSLEIAEKESLYAAGLDAWKAQVRKAMPEAGELLDQLKSFDEVKFATYGHVRMKQWHTNRCLLLGDAAHAMSPHLGQGINLALLDGLAIARALAVDTKPLDAFERYTQMRRSHTDFYAWVTYVLSPFFQSRGFVKGWLRDIGLPHLHRVPVFGPQMLLTMTGLKRSPFGGRINIDGGG